MNNVGKVSLAVTLFVSLLSTGMTAQAEDAPAASTTNTTPSSANNAPQPKTPGSGPNPFSDCGIGAALFPSAKPLAVTSNIIWDVGTTAITSATASPQTCSGKTLTAALFINNTLTNLAEETASGQGEHLTAVLNVFGCDKARHPAAIQQIRSAMGRVVASPNYVEQSHIDKASSYYSIVDEAVSTNCSV